MDIDKQKGLKEVAEILVETNIQFKQVSEQFAYLKYYKMVPPQVFDFLRSLKIDLDKESKSEERVYQIYTRKARGKKFYNPIIMVDEKMFNALNIVLRNNKSSIKNVYRDIKFYPDTRELRIWGFSMYIKKDSPRYDLCKYMFGKKRHPQGWQFWDLAVAIGEKPEIAKLMKRGFEERVLFKQKIAEYNLTNLLKSP